MLRLACFLVCSLFIGAALAAPSDYTAIMEVDAEGAADSPFTGRYEGATIVGQTSKEFDELSLPAGPANAKTKTFSQVVSQKGRVLRSLYVTPEARATLDVFGNHVDALKAKGFVTVFECAKASCGPNFKDLKYKLNDAATLVISNTANTRRVAVSKFMFGKIEDPHYALLKKGDAGNETYVAVFAAQNEGGNHGDVSKALKSRVGVLIESVEPGEREDKIVTLSADDIGTALGAEGRVVIYGVFFDFDRATIKPESTEQLAEMVRFLKNASSSRVFVVGHTDNTGELDYNLKLSTARAKAVADALSVAGIAPERLMAKGVGPLAPLSTNSNELGQAKNRRVELVLR
jgi:OmpA-OmpF porin, OOP family